MPGSAESIAHTELDNGVRILSEWMPGVRSAAVGVWVRQGSAHESEEDSGVSHMLEHMVFKGTAKRSASEIAAALEGLGGSLDAYTSREHTSYQARVLDEHVPEAMDVLSDLVQSPLLESDDLDLERQVVLEEIAQVEDTPDDLVFELHGRRMWNGHPYGRSILGTKDTVAEMTSERLRELHTERYRGANLVIAGAGNLDHGELAARADELFSGLEAGEKAGPVETPPGTVSGCERASRSSAQTHIVFGTAVPGRSHPDRYALVLLSAALGSGMSSRLFQKIREELALCYSVFTYQSFYAVSGVTGVYVGTRPATAERAAAAVREELAGAASEGLSADELERVKRQVKGHLMLSLESTGARMHRLAAFALHEEEPFDLDELLAKIDAVTAEDVGRVGGEYFEPARHLELRLGPA